jgi:hypothetical protein
MSGSRNIVLTLSTKGAEKVRADLEALGPAGEAALKRLDDAAKRSGSGMQAAGSGSDSLRQKLGGLGLQLQDVAVQAQSGTAALTILGQQGPQIASLFGPAGAIAGAGVVMAAFAAQLAIAALNGKQLSDVFKEIDAASKLADDAAKQRVKGLEDEATRLNALAAAYREYNAQALAGERARLTSERDALNKSTQSALSSVDSGTFGVGSVRGAVRAANYSGGETASPVEQAALDQLTALNDVASITRERLLEVAGALSEASKANGPFASALAGVSKELLNQIGPLTEAGEKARANAENLRLIEAASGGASGGITGVGNAATGTAGQVGGLNSALDATRMRLQALAQARVENPFQDVEESLKRIQAQRAALEKGGTEAFTAEQRRQAASAQISSRVDADVARLETALKATNTNGEEVTRRLTEARAEATRLRTEEANGQASLLNDVDARRRAEAEARKEATAGRAAARREDAEAAKERLAQIDLERRMYETLQRTPSGLLSGTTSDDKAIQAAERAMKGTAIDPDAVKKAADEAAKITDRYNTQQQRQSERTYDRIADYAGDRIADLFTDTEGGWAKTMENVRKTAIATFARIAAEALLRPIIMPVVQAFTGGGGGGVGGSAITSAGATDVTSVAGGASNMLGYAKQAGGLFSSGSNPLLPGYSFQGGYIGQFDKLAQTNVGGFLDTPVFSRQAPAFGPFSAENPTQAFTGNASTLSYGQAALGGASVIGGAYGIYSGIKTGGAKGFAQGVGGVAGVAGGAASIAAGSGMLAAGGAMAGAMATVAAVAPYIAAIAMVVAMLLPGQKPSDKTGTYTFNTRTGEGTEGGLTGDRNSAENREQAKTFSDGVNKLAANVGEMAGLKGAVDAQYRVGVGARDGVQVSIGDYKAQGAYDEDGTTAVMKALTAKFLQLAAEQTPDENVRKVINNSGTGDVDVTVANLDWYKTTYKDMAKTAQEYAAANNQFAQAMTSTRAPFDEAIEKAKNLGLATTDLAARQKEATDKLLAARDQTLKDIVQNAQDRVLVAKGGDTFERQMQVFFRDQDAQRRAAADQVRQLGVGEDQVNRVLQALVDAAGAEATAKVEANRQQVQMTSMSSRYDALSGLSSQGNVLSSFLSQQANADASPQQQFIAAQEAYRTALERASRAGAQDADLGAVTGAAGSLLTATSSFYGDGQEAALIKAGVTNQIKTLGGDLGLPGFTDSIDKSVDRWIVANTSNTAAIDRMTDRLMRLEDEMRVGRMSAIDGGAERSPDMLTRRAA